MIFFWDNSECHHHRSSLLSQVNFKVNRSACRTKNTFFLPTRRTIPATASLPKIFCKFLKKILKNQNYMTFCKVGPFFMFILTGLLPNV
jgi:hypothetical protein